MAKRKTISKEELHKAEITKVRTDQKEQGMFDGRFRTRSVESKKKYSRKKKHKNNIT